MSIQYYQNYSTRPCYSHHHGSFLGQRARAGEVEAAGIPTVKLTMMPDLASKTRVSRVLGVEFPFG